MKPQSLLYLALLAMILVSGCASGPDFSYNDDPALANQLDQHQPRYPDTRFAVFSDPHFYDPSLGTSGEAFDEYLANDRKLLAESSELVDAAIEAILAESPEFLIIPGDLTKDGEASGHRSLAQRLDRLEAAGIEVFVVPGNHDILSGDALRFDGADTEQVPTVNAAEFAAIYGQFGYDQALERDPASLSYLIEPVPGLWLLAIDSCRYRENRLDSHPITGGRLYPESIPWLESVLARSVEENKAVMAFMHHGVVEHWPGQADYHSEYVIEGYPQVARFLAEHKVRLVFTGHYHTQDVALERFDGRNEAPFIYDVATGSLVTFPTPYRMATVTDNNLRLESRYIGGIDSFDGDFDAYTLSFVLEGIYGIAHKTIKGLGTSDTEADYLSTLVAEAFANHYKGDEDPRLRTPISREGLGFMANLVLNNQQWVIDGLWVDSPAPDRNLTIDLATGGFQPLSVD